jgi:hypothetical protein
MAIILFVEMEGIDLTCGLGIDARVKIQKARLKSGI